MRPLTSLARRRSMRPLTSFAEFYGKTKHNKLVPGCIAFVVRCTLTGKHSVQPVNSFAEF